MNPSWLLTAFLFLLTADQLYLPAGNGKIKIAYLLLPFFWLAKPKAVCRESIQLLKRVDFKFYLLLAPLIISWFFSNDSRQSSIWIAWLAFNILTVFSIYGFLKAHSVSVSTIRNSSWNALGFIALSGMIQYLSIYILKKVILSPQIHEDIYRINGLAGWPHFLNIYSFLLLPIALTQANLHRLHRTILIFLLFVLIQSTSKTGWILFLSLSILLAIWQRVSFKKNILQFCLPLVILLLFVPSPTFKPTSNFSSGAEKAGMIAKDFEMSQVSSGRDRVLINLMGLKVASKNIVFGVGPRAYQNYIVNHFDHDLPGENKFDVLGRVNTRNENIWIELLAENGIIFTLGILFSVVFLLWPQNIIFTKPLYFGSWSSLVLYYSISGQFSQNILLTLVFAIWGIFFYSKEIES